MYYVYLKDIPCAHNTYKVIHACTFTNSNILLVNQDSAALNIVYIYIMHFSFYILYFQKAVMLCMMPIFFCITGCVIVVKDIKITAGTCKRKILLLVLIFVCHFSDNIYVHVNGEAFLPQWIYEDTFFLKDMEIPTQNFWDHTYEWSREERWTMYVHALFTNI